LIKVNNNFQPNLRGNMKKDEAVKLFGGVRPLAEALGLSVQAVHQWGEMVPPLRVYHIKELLAGRGEG
jgi:hypothetical protein